jgi:hypothetical protein
MVKNSTAGKDIQWIQRRGVKQGKGPEFRFREENPFTDMSLRAPKRRVAILSRKARLLRFARKDRILNRDLGRWNEYNRLTSLHYFVSFNDLNGEDEQRG